MIKTIADEKGITRSLDKLFLTQSAVSHQLRDIEERMGVKLFYRTKKQWILTEEGKILYDTATKVLSELDLANEKINDLRIGHSGEIRISTECYTSYHWLPAFMVKMKLLYPRLDVKIVMEATHKPLQKLLDNELDVGITSDPWDDKSIKYIELFKDEVMAVVPTGHRLTEKKYLTADDITNEVLIIHSYPLDTVTVYQHFLKPLQKQPGNIIAIPLTEVALEMVKAGMGIMTIPQWALKPFTASSALTLVRIGPKGLIRTHYAAIRHEDARKKYITDFIENLKEQLTK
ncbi:LysR family transcriptional regulator [Mucilaginibacter sp. X5P1]|uniref:LysR family transcriptional regulator n=1 Tax=Mucilaginibacter sp. X5P1 TaxID=2723088 RepID=UPI0018274AC4|nr:LysR family transcriptional regulator [Mucilaginibacter sp. X5P1]MBB6141413.1 LysR family transcriptional regulator for metE and metH [Mucilaginibacter sp. X5P1]